MTGNPESIACWGDWHVSSGAKVVAEVNGYSFRSS